MQTVFGLVTIIFIVCYLITVTTFREIPLELIERDELLRPLSDAAIKKEILKNKPGVYYIKEVNPYTKRLIPIQTLRRHYH